MIWAIINEGATLNAGTEYEKRQVGITHCRGKRLRSIGGLPLFKASVNDYRDMKPQKPGVYSPKQEGDKHFYVLFDRRKPLGKRKNKKGEKGTVGTKG